MNPQTVPPLVFQSRHRNRQAKRATFPNILFLIVFSNVRYAAHLCDPRILLGISLVDIVTGEVQVSMREYLFLILMKGFKYKRHVCCASPATRSDMDRCAVQFCTRYADQNCKEHCRYAVYIQEIQRDSCIIQTSQHRHPSSTIGITGTTVRKTTQRKEYGRGLRMRCLVLDVKSSLVTSHVCTACSPSISPTQSPPHPSRPEHHLSQEYRRRDRR